MSPVRRGRKRRRRDAEATVKDRLIQTRVPSRLENALKEEAKKRRLTVSHLIRNMLEDTLELVDTVVTGVDDIARSSAGLAEQVARDAGKIAAVARDSFRRAPATDAASPDSERPETPNDASAEPEPGPTSKPDGKRDLDAVFAWNSVVVNKTTECAECERELPRGTNAFLGVTSDPTAPPAWLCATCIENIQNKSS
jgi:hypothetical protein